MQRRKFLRTAALSAGGVASVSTLAAPAIAQSMPELKWRLASSFPKPLDTLYGAGEVLTKYVAEVTDNKFQMRIFAAGEIVPGLQVADAVQNGTVEVGHTAGGYYVGKDPTFAFDTALPFGMNTRQQTAWMNWGGGRELMNELYKDYNIYGMNCGATGAQMGGWFRKEIKSVDDLKGLKYRIFGLAGQVMAAAVIQPGVVLPLVDRERQTGLEHEVRVLAEEVIGRRLAALDGLVLHRVDDLQAGHDLAGGEDADLELVVGQAGDALGEVLARAEDRVERLGKARREAPFDLGHRLRDGRRGDGRRGGDSRTADTGRAQEFATLHCSFPINPHSVGL